MGTHGRRFGFGSIFYMLMPCFLPIQNGLNHVLILIGWVLTAFDLKGVRASKNRQVLGVYFKWLGEGVNKKVK